MNIISSLPDSKTFESLFGRGDFPNMAAPETAKSNRNNWLCNVQML